MQNVYLPVDGEPHLSQDRSGVAIQFYRPGEEEAHTVLHLTREQCIGLARTIIVAAEIVPPFAEAK